MTESADHTTPDESEPVAAVANSVETDSEYAEESALEWLPLLATLYLWSAVLVTGMRWLAHSTPWDGAGALLSIVLSVVVYHFSWSQRLIGPLAARLVVSGIVLAIWGVGFAVLMRGLGFPG